MKIVLSDGERQSLSDACAYLKEYEDSIVKNNDKFMLPFCADIAFKRLSLVDMCPTPFPFGIDYRDSVLLDIEVFKRGKHRKDKHYVIYKYTFPIEIFSLLNIRIDQGSKTFKIIHK